MIRLISPRASASACRPGGPPSTTIPPRTRPYAAGGVIAGRAKGPPPAAPARGGATRPTSDLVRGAIFSALDSMGADLSRALDLYAGSGALGIEALSRGARRSDFVEKDPRACASIRQSLSKTGFEGQGEVLCLPVERALP